MPWEKISNLSEYDAKMYTSDKREVVALILSEYAPSINGDTDWPLFIGTDDNPHDITHISFSNNFKFHASYNRPRNVETTSMLQFMPDAIPLLKWAAHRYGVLLPFTPGAEKYEALATDIMLEYHADYIEGENACTCWPIHLIRSKECHVLAASLTSVGAREAMAKLKSGMGCMKVKNPHTYIMSMQSRFPEMVLLLRTVSVDMFNKQINY